VVLFLVLWKLLVQVSTADPIRWFESFLLVHCARLLLPASTNKKDLAAFVFRARELAFVFKTESHASKQLDRLGWRTLAPGDPTDHD